MLQGTAWCPTRRSLPAAVQGGAEGTKERVLVLRTMLLARRVTSVL